jgi:hypothetical protein
MNNHILVFIKYPQKGLVKSRLAADMDETAVIELYRCFVLDTLDALKNVNAQIWICYWPRDFKTKFINWLGTGYGYIPQNGKDLGERLKYCFRKVFQHDARGALVIGSDSPDITEDIIRSAFSYLENHDAVIGPTFDGGYYLLGFRQKTFLPEVFEDILWSTPKVFSKTIQIISNHNKKYFVLEKRHDVDTIEDVNQFIAGNNFGEFSRSRSMQYLRGINSKIEN